MLYWRLYDSYSQTAWADDLAQTAGLGQPYSENCSPQCLLSAIFDGPLQYWSRLPNGAAIGPNWPFSWLKNSRSTGRCGTLTLSSKDVRRSTADVETKWVVFHLMKWADQDSGGVSF